MKLDKQNFDKYFEGNFVTDCVVRAKDLIYFVLEQEDDDGPAQTSIIVCAEREGMPAWSRSLLKGNLRMKAGVSYVPKEQFVGVTAKAQIYALGSGDGGLEDDLKGVHSRQLQEAHAGEDQYLLRGPIMKLRTIEGRVYGCGLGRTVIDRIGKNNWNYHTSLPKDKSAADPTGFEDIDGFSAHDIYAVGGSGDVWHYNGQKWKQIPFPSNMDLWTVCCAPDGVVYIGAESGNVFKGRDNKWTLIARGDLALPFKDMVWHTGAVWCTSDYGLWTVKDDKLTAANVPAGISVCAGNLSVGDGVMLLAGAYGAALHDGKVWNRVIDFNDFK